MRRPEEVLLKYLKNAGVDFTSSLPCEKIKTLLEMIEATYGNPPLHHVPLTREEEGVGICAGASLAGKRPAIFVQSSGIGNMINALLSLTAFYELPLAVFVSRRGVYKEKIEAQFPMGLKLPGILKGAELPFSIIDTPGDFTVIERKLEEAYKKNKIHIFLLSPEIWENSEVGIERREIKKEFNVAGRFEAILTTKKMKPEFTRYEIMKMIAPFLDSKVVVCNLGFPCKELFHIKHQSSNFYMLGSMGMATPIGLGISLSTEKETVVIDGDGSLLMNPGTLATAAFLSPGNLTILAVDNGAYGSTGNQRTLTSSCVELEAVARGFGITNTRKAASRKDFYDVLSSPVGRLHFIHALAVPGNRDLPTIPVGHLEIRDQVREFLTGA